GAYAQDFALAKDARIGTWRAELKLDPKAPSIGTIEFRVEDFVPPTLKVALDAPDTPVRPGQPYDAQVTATYYYGAPGAGLSAEASAAIAYDDNPYPGQPGYQFGLVDEKYDGESQDIDVSATDDQGKTTVTLSLDKVPDKTKPLAATIKVSVFEPSGRAIGQTVTRPIRQRDLAIGLRQPGDDDTVAEGKPAVVDLIALDGAGKRIAAKGLRWELVRERWQYDWYSTGGSWRNRVTVRDEPIETGTVDIGATSPPGCRARSPRAAIAGRSPTARAARRRACVSMSAGGSRTSCPTCPTNCR